MFGKVASKKQFNTVLSVYDSLKNSDLYEALELNKDKDKVLKLSSEVDGTKFKIAVIGEFSTGKSTIINSFLQKDILPVKYRPTTNQITIIKNSKSEYVRIENQPETTLELVKENVAKLNESSNKNLEIGLALPNLSEYEIYDTPGVNDPSMFSDEIVFDLIGGVDIAVFVMNATQVLKQSEISFLTKLIRKKDINKFFFVINQVDIIGDEKYEVRDDFLERLSSLLAISKEQIAQQTFLYSAKDSLNASLNSNSQELLDSGYETLISGIDSFIKENKQGLFDDVVQRELALITKDTLLKIDTTIDKIDNKDKEYETTLEVIHGEIISFQSEVEDAIYDFRKNFDTEKENFKDNIKQSFNAISDSVVGEIANIPIDKLTQDRYVEIRTKKLIEDATEDEFQKFSKSLTLNFQNLDNTIEPIFNHRNIVINDLVKKNISSTVVSGLAIGGGVLMAIAYTPTILTVGAIGIGVSALGSAGGGAIGLLAGGPAGAAIGTTVGSAASGVVGTAGILLMQAGKFALDLGKWGVKVIANIADKAEDVVKVKKYQTSVRESINTIKESILLNIEQEFSHEKYLEAFINEKFPQKSELEKRIEQSKKDFQININDSSIEKNQLEQIKLELEGSLR
jgi:small GTP-binding protein